MQALEQVVSRSFGGRQKCDGKKKIQTQIWQEEQVQSTSGRGYMITAVT